MPRRWHARCSWTWPRGVLGNGVKARKRNPKRLWSQKGTQQTRRGHYCSRNPWWAIKLKVRLTFVVLHKTKCTVTRGRVERYSKVCCGYREVRPFYPLAISEVPVRSMRGSVITGNAKDTSGLEGICSCMGELWGAAFKNYGDDRGDRALQAVNPQHCHQKYCEGYQIYLGSNSLYWDMGVAGDLNATGPFAFYTSRDMSICLISII